VGRQIGEKMDRVAEKKRKNRVEYMVLVLMLLFGFVYLLMPIHIRMAGRSCYGLLGLFFTREILFEVSLVDGSYVLRSDQIVTKDFRAPGVSREDLLLQISTKRPIILVVEDDNLDRLTDKELAVVKDVFKKSSNFVAQYLYPLSYRRRKARVVLRGVRKPDQTAIYAFLRKSYFLSVVKEGNVTALYDRCQSKVIKSLLSNEVIGSSLPQ
jgi:hypothetical protein